MEQLMNKTMHSKQKKKISNEQNENKTQYIQNQKKKISNG